MKTNFTPEDIQQIEDHGLTMEAIEKQFDNFKNGFPKTHLVEAATISNGGIVKLEDAELKKYISLYEQLSYGKKILKFIPASGAASRMFKDLYAFSSTYFGVAKNFEKEFPSVKDFLENIRTFAFYNDLAMCMKRNNLDITEYLSQGEYTTIINYLLKEKYLGYGSLPKALLKFHKYGQIQRTPLEEHIVEGVEYALSSNNTLNLHFTVSPEHRPLFRKKLSQVKHFYEETFGIKISVTLSEQKHYTDTIAVDEYNNPLRDENNQLVFRPAGHGALIENLNDCRADIIHIKNIDNVVPDWMKHTTIVYKQILSGLLLELQQTIFSHLKTLDHNPSCNQIQEIEQFAIQKLHASPLDPALSDGEKITVLHNLLNRPIRVCGMVKNQGEPGGGPFFVKNTQGEVSLQIVETAQINHKDPQQEGILQSATHFNPVDLVCATKDYKGHYFNLREFVDPQTGFIAKKSKGSSIVKSQELPGLWNGAMAKWNTIFVEVPLATFNPVKTVNDLLRTEHRENN